MAAVNSDFQDIRRQESHAHTYRFSDGPLMTEYFSEVEDVEHVAVVDHISPEAWKPKYLDVGREGRYFVGSGEDIESRSLQIEWASMYADDIRVYRGAEIDTVPGTDWAEAQIKDNSDHLDLVHLSHHYLIGDNEELLAIKDGEFEDFSGFTSEYFDRIEKTIDMLRNLDVDLPVIIAHPGLPENNDSIEMDLEYLEQRYWELIEGIEDIPDAYLELNLKTEERANCDSAGEMQELLEKDEELETTLFGRVLVESGVPFTVGSDVHRSHETDVRMEMLADLLDTEDLENAVPLDRIVD